MAQAFAEGRRVTRDDGIGCVVFAHKTTEGWEALLSGLIAGGWIITASWPIATERPGRMRARDSAALATSVHLVCRPRRDHRIGEWAEVLRELPGRVTDWMQRLQAEDIRGADLVFACIGPALEIFSRYACVETPDGRTCPSVRLSDQSMGGRRPLRAGTDPRLSQPAGGHIRLAAGRGCPPDRPFPLDLAAGVPESHTNSVR